MTALERYRRLECPGLWHGAEGAQRRDVVVTFGEASLVIRDLRSDAALAHWSLPAVERLNPRRVPAIFGPDRGATETLEIDDPSMIEAIETVARVVRRNRRPGRVQLAFLGAGLLAVIGVVGIVAPRAVIVRAAAVVPPAARAALGARILADMAPTWGAPCRAPAGLSALDALRDRLGRDPDLSIAILPNLRGTLHLPGRIVAVGRSVIEAEDDPDVFAGHVIAEATRADRDDPLLPLLRNAGLAATARFLTTGTLPEDSIAGYGADLAAAPPASVRPAELAPRFAAAGIASEPYSRAAGGDPVPEPSAPTSAMTDSAWVALQGICD